MSPRQAVLTLALVVLSAGAVSAAAVRAQVVDEGFTETPLGDADRAPEAGIERPQSDFEEQELLAAPRARLRGLDTVNNTVDDFEIEVGQTLIFKRLEITLESCRYRAGGNGTDAFAYLRIRDRREEEPRFEGWMLSSSPALSALDHPRYDVWVIACRT